MEINSLLENNIPLVAYSFSSRGFPDVIEKIQKTLPSLSSAYLLSLYDLCYLNQMRELLTSSDDRIRIWDSGGYEKRLSDDVSAVVSAVPSSSAWNAQRYVDASNSIPWNGKDILVSFDDDPHMSVNQQLERAFDCYKQIRGTYFRDVILHVPSNCNIDALVDELIPNLPNINIVGFTEKEIAPTWKQGVQFIDGFNRSFQRYDLTPPPIHLFGCLDPKSIIYFTFAGVSIFDGLSWLRFLFDNRMTLYRREFEFMDSFDGISRELDIDTAIIRHNINEIETLRSDLVYDLAVGDNTLFTNERKILRDILVKGD